MKQVFLAHMDQPSPTDFYSVVKSDIEILLLALGLTISDIEEMSKTSIKALRKEFKRWLQREMKRFKHTLYILRLTRVRAE